MNHFTEVIKWDKTNDPEYPYSSQFKGASLKIRINDFPIESLYTLIENEVEIGDFDDWPKVWERLS